MMIGGSGNFLTAAVLASFINTVYARPWLSDERALLLPGILGGLIGYAIGMRLIQGSRVEPTKWAVVAVASGLAVAFSYAYNEELLLMAAKPPWYKAVLYMCFISMNMSAFCAFGAIGWTLTGKSEQNDT